HILHIGLGIDRVKRKARPEGRRARIGRCTKARPRKLPREPADIGKAEKFHREEKVGPCEKQRTEPQRARDDDEQPARPDAKHIGHGARKTERRTNGKQAEICRTRRETHRRNKKRAEKESLDRHERDQMTVWIRRKFRPSCSRHSARAE